MHTASDGESGTSAFHGSLWGPCSTPPKLPPRVFPLSSEMERAGLRCPRDTEGPWEVAKGWSKQHERRILFEGWQDDKSPLRATLFLDSGAPGLEGTLSFPEETITPSSPCQQVVNSHSGISWTYTSKTAKYSYFFEKHFKFIKYGMLVIKKFKQAIKK